MYRRLLACLALGATVFAACATSTRPSASPGAPVQVPTGANVTVDPVADPATGLKSVAVTFGNVTAAGDIAIKTTTSAPALPAGIRLTGGAIFDVTTSAKFDKATLCLESDKVTASSKLFHFADGKWNDRTTTVTPPKICGNFTSFSPTAIVEGSGATPTPTATASATASATATATATATASATATPTGTATATATATAAPTPTQAQASPTQALATPTQAPTPTVAPTPTPVPTPTPSPTPVVPYPGYIFAANASGPVPSGFTRYGATVKDATTGAPVVGACVYTGPPAGCPLRGANQTDANGFFAVDLPSGSDFAFTVEHPSYKAIIQATLAKGSTSSSLTMSPK